MKSNYEPLPRHIMEQIEQDKASGVFGQLAFPDEKALRRNPSWDKNTLLRPSFVRDCEKILHLPVYNRYNDKTQVFSLYENDDISRRGLHVQLVSRIARNIGRLLGLNQDLIEAIALGHDLGHTPFGHAGERFLDSLLFEHTGRHFLHNLQSVRVLDVLYRRNVSLQTLDGILCHNGEFEQQEYKPADSLSFAALDGQIRRCLQEGEAAAKALVPGTLEACVVRISDMIAYLGKDRQDAITAHILPDMNGFTSKEIGTQNAMIINNLVVDIVSNSYGKRYILMSPGAYNDLKNAKAENNRYIYRNETLEEAYRQTVAPMFRDLYEQFLTDLEEQREDSMIYRHHIRHLQQQTKTYCDRFTYLQEDPHQIAVDYLASMTDNYFVRLHELLFPSSPYRLAYHSYFQQEESHGSQ